jgi:hypothetical protein
LTMECVCDWMTGCEGLGFRYCHPGCGGGGGACRCACGGVSECPGCDECDDGTDGGGEG